MFTREQITQAHSKVKSGADFPAYIREIKSLGVIGYEAFVTDGRINYKGTGHTVEAPARYEPLPIVDTPQIDRFKSALVAHQQGETDFLTFITMCAMFGIEKWQIRMDKMTCTYYDKVGNAVLVERIPE